MATVEEVLAEVQIHKEKFANLVSALQASRNNPQALQQIIDELKQEDATADAVNPPPSTP